ncbi:MAG: hypothetical protein HY067_08930 [Betaproteobacteria bacterium]|nr:hypothetical protein [Betaproteobacteria bacterium]
MSLAVISLFALFVVVAVGSFLPVNLGVLSIAFACLVGVVLGGMKLPAVLAGFPAGLFLTLIGVTLFFSQARVNGTLERMSAVAVGLVQGRAGAIPIVFFFLASGFASIGPGNIAAVALLAPLAMIAAGRAGVPRVRDGDHGVQRRQCRRAVAVCTEGDHRQRTDDQNRTGRRAVDQLHQSAGCAIVGRVRRLFHVRRHPTAGDRKHGGGRAAYW